MWVTILRSCQIAVCISILLSASAAMAKDRVVKCQINSGVSSYKGKCLFTPDKGGSFSLQKVNKEGGLIDETSIVSVTIIDKGVAEVSGLTKEGINSRWGEAYRSSQDQACWVGDDFKVCAW